MKKLLALFIAGILFTALPAFAEGNNDVGVYYVGDKEFHVPKEYRPMYKEGEFLGVYAYMPDLDDIENLKKQAKSNKKERVKNTLDIRIKHDKYAEENAHFPTRAHGQFTRAKKDFISMEGEPSYLGTRKFEGKMNIANIFYDAYLLFDDEEIVQHYITCNRKNEARIYGRCSTFIYPIDKHIVVYYTFKRPHLADWRNVDNQVRELILSFLKNEESTLPKE